MAVMTADDIEKELRRKAAANELPTSATNMGRYNEIKSEMRADSINKQREGLYSELAGLRNELTKQAQVSPFSYDPNTDPQYQAALRQARTNSQTAAGDIAAYMNKRNILNSTITADRANQAAQREYSRVSDTVLPQLMQQAYGRYNDQINRQRQGVLDQLGLIESQYGMTSDEDARMYRDKTFDRGVLESDRGYNRGVLESDRNFDRGVLESDRNFDRGVLESDRNFNRGVLESDRNYNRGVLESDRNYGLSSDREKRLGASEGLTNLYRIWESTGIAPDGIPGVKPGTPLYDPVLAREQARPEKPAELSPKESTDNLSQAKTYIEKLDKDQAKNYAKGIRDWLTDSDYRSLINYIDDM